MTRAWRIQFAGDAEWGAYSQVEMGRWAKSAEVTPLAVRLLFAAMGRHDASGHAPFRSGELRETLGSVDVQTGEVRPARSDVVSGAIKTAKRLGFVAEDSTARCLILHRHAFQKGGRAGTVCTVHDL